MKPAKLFAPIIALLALTGCFRIVAEPPTSTTLSVSTAYMTGVTSLEVKVNSGSQWRLEPDATPWLSVTPSSGSGDALVRLNADPAGLDASEYYGELRLTDLASGKARKVPVIFAFPRLTGRIEIAQSSGILDGLSAARGTSEFEQRSLAEHLPAAPGRLLVGLERATRGGLSSQEAERLDSVAGDLARSGKGLKLLSSYPLSGVAVFEASNMRAAALGLVRNPHVRYVEQDRDLERLAMSNDQYRPLQWSLTKMKVEEAWTAAGNRGSGVRVAVIDGGFQPTPGHPDMATPNYVYNFAYGSSSVQSYPDCASHGEHVAGIVGASADNGQGVAGVAPHVELLLLDISLDQPGCPLSSYGLIDALEYVVNSGNPRAEVINMSLGGGYSRSIHDAVKAAYAAGVVMVAAAGNDRGPVLYPAAYPEVLAVSATGPSDELSSYSSRGPEVFVAAPGGNAGPESSKIYSTYYWTDTAQYGYGYMQGTSMASPAAAGVAALIKAVRPSFSPDNVADVLAMSSVDLGSSGRDDEFGYGRVDAEAAVTLAASFSGSPRRYQVRLDGAVVAIVPFHGEFDLGYRAPGQYTVEVASDEDGDGVYGESGEYSSGPVAVEVSFGQASTDVTVPVTKKP